MGVCHCLGINLDQLLRGNRFRVANSLTNSIVSMNAEATMPATRMMKAAKVLSMLIGLKDDLLQGLISPNTVLSKFVLLFFGLLKAHSLHQLFE